MNCQYSEHCSVDVHIAPGLASCVWRPVFASTLVTVEHLLSFEKVAVRLGQTPILHGLTAQVSAGDVVGLSGPNGSGKSTLLKAAATLLRPSEGKGTVLGADMATAGPATRAQIGMLAHEPAVFGELTLLENLEFVARLTGRPIARARELLEAVGLKAAADRRADRSSHGMARRTDIARLVLTEPKLVLLDEATAGLDEAAVELIATVIARTTNAGGAVILVTHDTAYLESITNRRWHLTEGTIRESSS